MQQQLYSIVQVTDQLNVGGAEQIIVMLANLLQAHEHSTAVITTVAPGPLANKLHPGVQLINLHRRWKWNLLTMYRLIKVLKRFDVVHVHSSYNLRYVYLASRLFFLRKPIFYHEHYGNAVNTLPNTLQQYIYTKTYFIAVSNKLAIWAKSTIKLTDKKVFVLPNTIVKRNIPETYQSSDELHLCMVGNILPNKNIHFALQVLQALQQLKKQTSLTIIGNITDDKYYKHLLTFIDENDLEQSVSFVTDCSDAQNLLHQFTAAIHCSLSESGPLVLIEYLAQGVPFITYNTGEVVQQLQPHIPDFIMQDFDLEKWLQAIKHIIALPRQEIAGQFEYLYKTNFSPETYYINCLEIYKKGLQSKP